MCLGVNMHGSYAFSRAVISNRTYSRHHIKDGLLDDGDSEEQNSSTITCRCMPRQQFSWDFGVASP